MSHNHTVRVLNFVGYDEILPVAIEKATAALKDWYEQQQVLFTSDGASVYQMSASALHRIRADGTHEYEYVITVFDTRGTWAWEQ